MIKYTLSRSNYEGIRKRNSTNKRKNKRVEKDKAWETSWTRRICIMILTYVVVVIYSYIVQKYNNIFFSSIVPVIGFTLSTLSLKLVRKIWEKKKEN